MIKTFRGQIADGGQDTIVLHTNDGSTGYRIVKFQVMPPDPSNTALEAIVQIWKVPQTSFDALIDFSDQTMLAAAFYSGHTSAAYPQDVIIVFDREIFNQDIYITHFDDNGSVAINYYLELEQVPLDLGENTVATLKNIKNNANIL